MPNSLNRRRFLSIASISAAAITTGILSGCGNTDNASSGNVDNTSTPPDRSGRTFTFNGSGGAYQKAIEDAWIAPAAKELGLKWASDSTGTTDLLNKALVQKDIGTITWDLVDMTHTYSAVLAKAGYLQPLDYSIIDRSQVPDGASDEYSISTLAVPKVMAYNTDRYSEDNHPKTWEEYWDLKKFPGKRLFFNKPDGGMLEAALLSEGVSRDSLFPLDVDRAFKRLDAIRSELVPYSGGNQGFQSLIDKQTDLACVQVGRLNQAIEAGAPYAPEWTDAFVYYDVLAVPKGTPYAEEAMKIINYALHPEPQAKFVEAIGYGPANPKAFDLLEQKYLDTLAVSPQHDETTIRQDSQWYADHWSELNTRWAAWAAAG